MIPRVFFGKLTCIVFDVTSLIHQLKVVIRLSQYLKANLSSHNVCAVLELADLHQCSELYAQATRFWCLNAACFATSPALALTLYRLPLHILEALLDQEPVYISVCSPLPGKLFILVC